MLPRYGVACRWSDQHRLQLPHEALFVDELQPVRGSSGDGEAGNTKRTQPSSAPRASKPVTRASNRLYGMSGASTR